MYAYQRISVYYLLFDFTEVLYSRISASFWLYFHFLFSCHCIFTISFIIFRTGIVKTCTHMIFRILVYVRHKHSNCSLNAKLTRSRSDVWETFRKRNFLSWSFRNYHENSGQLKITLKPVNKMFWQFTDNLW